MLPPRVQSFNQPDQQAFHVGAAALLHVDPGAEKYLAEGYPDLMHPAAFLDVRHTGRECFEALKRLDLDAVEAELSDGSGWSLSHGAE